MKTGLITNRTVSRLFVNTLNIIMILAMALSANWIPASAAFPGDNGKIAFMSNQDGNFEIYVMKSDGSGQTNLTNNPAYDGAPSWSADGSQILFMSERDGNYEIYRMNADGSDLTRLTTDPSTDMFPSWSPDGSQIVFARYDLSIGNYEIWRMNSDGTGAVPLTANTAEDMEPVWSPDGTKILFHSDRDGNSEIYMMNPDGTGQTNLTNNPDADGEADWSPDGSKIVFASTRENLGALWVMNADGSSPTRITDAVYGDSQPSWSPDGTRIVFKGFRDYNDEIYVMNADGTGVTRLTNNALPGNTLPEDWFPDWQPLASPPSPSLRAHPVWDNVDGWNWPEEATLHLAIDDPGTELSPDLEMELPGTIDPNIGSVWFDFAGTYDLKPGDQVTMSDGTTTKSLVVSSHEITAVDLEAETIKGTADPGTQVRLPVPSELLVTANENGTWLADFGQAGVDLQPGTTFIAEVFDEDGDNSSYELYVSNPRFEVRDEADSVAGWDWQPNGEVSISIDGAPITTAPVDASGYFGTVISELLNIVPGMNVEVSDGVHTKALLVSSLHINNVDVETEIVTGIATPDRRIQAEVCVQDGCIDRWETVDGAGNWSADFSVPGDEPGEERTFDFGPGTRVDVREWDEDGDNAISGYYVPNPRMVVFPESEWFDGLDWPDGATVTITVEGKPECKTSRESHGYFFNGNFGEGCNLEIGDTVTFSDGNTTRTHVVRSLGITAIHPEDETITGFADPGIVVYVWPHDGWFEPLQATTDDSGSWQANLGTVGYDIREGRSGRSQINDELGNATAVDWYVPNPRFTVFPKQETIELIEWPIGANVYLSIDDPATDVSPDFEGNYTVQTADWDPGQSYMWIDIAGQYDIKTGDVVMLTDGAVTRTHTVQYLNVNGAYDEPNTVTGTADPGATINVWPHATGEQIQAITAETGNWLVDFTDIFDLVPGEAGRAQINDEQGNGTAVDWYVPNPRIVASITENWIYLLQFSPETQVHISIYERQGGPQVWEGTAMTDLYGWAWINAEEHNQDLEPGAYLVISDGAYTKDLVIEPFTFDLFDATKGLLKGTAPQPFGRRVWVGIGWQDDGWSMDVTTNAKGAWNANYGGPVPNGYQWVAAQLFDPDGDASELRPARTTDRSVTAGNFFVDWSNTNPEEIVDLRWNGWVGLTNTWTHPACPDDLEFFGNSWASENEGGDPFFFASLVGWGTIGTWKDQTGPRIRIGSTSSGCPGSADIPIKTEYRFFADQLRANLMVVQRTVKFGDIPYAHDFRPYIPRLYPSDGFTQVLHPNSTGDTLVTDITCDYGCVAESWDGSWFAIHNPYTGVGVIVQRKSSPYSAVLWLDDDDGSFTNASSILLRQPQGGFTEAVTETEFLCFYDSNTWTPSLTIPDGCQP